MTERRANRNTAVLRGLDASGREVVVEQLDLHSYWDDSHPLVDEDGHRQALGVVTLVGELHGSDGLLMRFENRYSASGQYLGGRAEHADGTVTED